MHEGLAIAGTRATIGATERRPESHLLNEKWRRKMSSNDHDRIALAREYFIRADQGRPDVLDLFHEDAELYFPKFGFGSGRQSLFEMVKGFEGSLEYIRHDYDNLTFIPSGEYLVVEPKSGVKCVASVCFSP